MAYDLARLEKALINADKAGDVEAATAFANEIRSMRAESKAVPDRSGLDELGRQVGLTGRHLIEGATFIPQAVGNAANELVNMVTGGINKVAGTDISRLQPVSQILSQGLTKAGLPEPQNATERVVGDISQAMAGAGSLAGLPAMATKLSPAILGKLAQLAENPAMQAVTSATAAGAGGVTRESGGGPLAQIIASLLGGLSPVAIKPIARGIGSAARGLVAPFFESGQSGIAGRTLSAFAGNADEAARNMAVAREIVPGSLPTAAEASKDAGIAQLQRSLANASPKLSDDLTQRALDQNSARMAALTRVTGTPDDLLSATARRTAIGEKIYNKAFKHAVPANASLATLAERPSMQAAIKKANTIAAESGKPLGNLFDKSGKQASVRGLHYVKLALDDMVDTAPLSGIGKSELFQIQKTRAELLKWLQYNSPAYNSARVRFEKASRPIRRMEVGQGIMDRATGSQMRNIRGEFTLSPAQFGQAIKADEKLVKAATGQTANKGIAATMTPKQNAALAGIKADLERSSSGQSLGKAFGSNTAQNLASQDLLREVFGKSVAGSAFAQTLTRPISFATKIGEEGIRNALARALTDPAYAASLMKQPSAGRQITDLQRMLADLLQSALGTAAGVGTLDVR